MIPLEVIIILPGVEEIPQQTFTWCMDIETVIMANKVRRIRQGAFGSFVDSHRLPHQVILNSLDILYLIYSRFVINHFMDEKNEDRKLELGCYMGIHFDSFNLFSFQNISTLSLELAVFSCENVFLFLLYLTHFHPFFLIVRF